jgi:hypothetical protein
MIDQYENKILCVHQEIHTELPLSTITSKRVIKTKEESYGSIEFKTER